jgi:hypothetical protein
MSTLYAKPGFGTPKMAPAYYEQIDGILRVLRPMSTLRVIAQHLTNAGFRTPLGHVWDRQKVATYLRSRSI